MPSRNGYIGKPLVTCTPFNRFHLLIQGFGIWTHLEGGGDAEEKSYIRTDYQPPGEIGSMPAEWLGTSVIEKAESR